MNGGVISISQIAENLPVHIKGNDVCPDEVDSFIQEAVSGFLGIAISASQARQVFDKMKKSHRVRMPDRSDRDGKIKFI